MNICERHEPARIVAPFKQHFGELYEQILSDLQSDGNVGECYTPRAVTAFMADRIDPRPGEILLDPACGTGGVPTCAIRHMRSKYVTTVEDEQRMQRGLRAIEKKRPPRLQARRALGCFACR